MLTTAWNSRKEDLEGLPLSGNSFPFSFASEIEGERRMLRQPSEPDHCEPGEEEDPEEGFGGCVSHSLAICANEFTPQNRRSDLPR
jgi:hypothetical protein